MDMGLPPPQTLTTYTLSPEQLAAELKRLGVGPYIPKHPKRSEADMALTSDEARDLDGMILAGTSFHAIKKALRFVGSATIRAHARKLGLEWIGERWEQIGGLPDGDGADANEALTKAIAESIAAGLAPETIAQQEHVEPGVVFLHAAVKGVGWDAGEKRWRPSIELPPMKVTDLPEELEETTADPLAAPQAGEGERSAELPDEPKSASHIVVTFPSPVLLGLDKPTALRHLKTCEHLRVETYQDGYTETLQLIDTVEPLFEQILLG